VFAHKVNLETRNTSLTADKVWSFPPFITSLTKNSGLQWHDTVLAGEWVLTFWMITVRATSGSAQHIITSQNTWILNNCAAKNSKCTPVTNFGILGTDDKMILKQILEKQWMMMCAASNWFRTELSDTVL
jgi:hypothetical protein